MTRGAAGGREQPAMTARAAARRAGILAAAAELITEHGFEGTTLDAVCERAACSKTAIYELFGGKTGLLAALSEDIAVELSQALHAFHMQELSPRETLLRYSRLALAKILAGKHIAVVRATIAAASSDPAIGPAYYRVGALTAQAALAQYFREQTRAGALEVADPEWAAHELQGLLFWERMLAQIVGAAAPPGAEEIARHSEQAVEAFMQRYGVK